MEETPRPKRGLTCGAFDLCHAGHMLMFREAKTVCDYLIVGLQIDPSVTDESYRGKKKSPPVMSAEERLIILEGIKYIDEIFIYTTEEDLLNELKAREFDVRIIGADWQGKRFTGDDLGKEVFFNTRPHGYSTTELKTRVKNAA